MDLRYLNVIDPMIFIGAEERWLIVTILDAKPSYYVSSYGRMYNTATNKFIIGHVSDNGYVLVSFRNTRNERVYTHLHRLIMLTFYPIQNPELFVVNHIDGIKTNNHIWNLEWTTQQGNVKHAFGMGLRKYGEGSSHVCFISNEVHSVCKCMENGMNYKQISEFVFKSEPTQQILTLCKNILSKKYWREISINYDIDNFHTSRNFSLNQIKIICSCLEKDSNMPTEEILKALGILSYTKEEFIVYNRSIRLIRKGISYKSISKNYNI